MEGPTKGKLVRKDGKYFVEAGDERHELAPLPGLADEEQLAELLDQEVDVLYSEPQRYVVGVKPLKLKRFILCYIVPPPGPMCYYPIDPWLLKGVEDHVRANVAKRLLETRVISEEVYEKLR